MAAKDTKKMEIHTCYTVKIKHQLDAVPDRKTKKLNISRKRRVDDRSMQQTAEICLEALRFCVDVALKEWDHVKAQERRRAFDILLHGSKKEAPKYPEFDIRFSNMPAYMRRALIADAVGMVKSYRSNHANWKALSPAERGVEPKIGFPSRYELTFYDQERKMSNLAEGQIGLKLYNGKTWDWYYFEISASDAGKLAYRILAVDLGINAAASWCVMKADGTVHAKGVIHLPCEEDRLNHMINRKRMYQQAGKKSHCVYRWIRNANRALSIETARKLIEVAVLYSVDCIVFEYLDSKGKIRGKKFRERIHLWRKNDVQKRVELQAHRLGMRLSRVCAWGTSKYAFDGSGVVDRHSIYHFEHGKKVYNYSLCTFQNGKIYNCDLSAAQNIGARFFLREYQKKGADGLPSTPLRTLSTLREFVNNGQPMAA